MKRLIIIATICILGLAVIGVYRYLKSGTPPFLSPMGEDHAEKPFEKYAIARLTTSISPSVIEFDEVLATQSGVTRKSFHFTVSGKRVTGLAHIPDTAKVDKVPVILQYRGYVDREKYTTGEGTKRSGEVYARNGFLTLAPDFLGYGGSDTPSSEIFEERFQTYTTALTLLASVKSIPFADTSNIGIWGHSNGGQIALTVLEATGLPIPTTLWAPVTKPFPYSILYYTDDLSDKGKYLRRKLAEFESEYDVFDYSLTNHIDRITAQIQLHQGTADDAVPKKWNDEFVRTLTDAGKDITYYVYDGADHNMMGSWNTVVERDIEFFRKQFTITESIH